MASGPSIQAVHLPHLTRARWSIADRGFWFWLGVIVAAGVVIRVLYTVLLAPWPPPAGDDPWFYHYEAIFLAHGRGFISVNYALLGVTRPSAAHPPLYPFVLAGLAKLEGTGQETQRLAGSVFGAGTIIVLGLLGRRVGGQRVGLVAAGLAAVYPMLVTADGALMSESLYGLMIGLCLLAAYRLLEAQTPARALVLGVLLGLAVLARGEALLLIPLGLVPVVRRPRGWRTALVVCSAVIVVVAPWTIRNWVVFHRPVLVSTDLASAIAGANCPSSYYGSDVGSWDNACVKPYGGNEAQAFDRSQADGLRYAGQHLGRLPVLAVTRLARVWGLRRNLPIGGSLPHLSGRAPAALEMGFLMYYVLALLSVYGFVLLRRRAFPVWILMSPFLLVSISAVLVYGDVRFREPAELSLVVLAAVAVEALWRRRSDSRKTPASLAPQ